MTTSKEIHLVRRPVGEPQHSDFMTVETTVPDGVGPGELLVRNTWMSVDPYMRGRMSDTKSYVEPFALDAPLDGGAVGTVVASGDPAIPVGADVLHDLGWREYALVPASTARVVDTSAAPAPAYLGVLGMPGLTAYTGLTRIAPVKEGDVVFVSGAAGAVGLVAGTVARKKGASRVIGSAGGPEKTKRLVEEFGFDAAIDYRSGNLRKLLAEAAPDGIDVYFDNVGGDHLRAALSEIRNYGRIALCGAISQYNAIEPAPGPDNLAVAVARRLTLRGYIVTDHADLFGEYVEQASQWLRDGDLTDERMVVEGIDHAVDAFRGLLSGANTGKMVVRL
jgi:NADPH-dependent curcumin reductase CurA